MSSEGENKWRKQCFGSSSFMPSTTHPLHIHYIYIYINALSLSYFSTYLHLFILFYSFFQNYDFIFYLYLDCLDILSITYLGFRVTPLQGCYSFKRFDYVKMRLCGAEASAFFMTLQYLQDTATGTGGKWSTRTTRLCRTLAWWIKDLPKLLLLLIVEEQTNEIFVRFCFFSI